MALGVVLVVLTAACGDANVVQRQAVAADDGMQGTGQIAGSRIAVSSGNPDVVLGDCDPGSGSDRDLCVVGRTIDGRRVTIVIENPDALVAGEDLEVRGSGCEEAACDDETGFAVVDLRVDREQMRVTSGRLEVSEAGPRYVLDFNLRFPGGDTFVGEFNVVPPGADPAAGPRPPPGASTEGG